MSVATQLLLNQVTLVQPLNVFESLYSDNNKVKQKKESQTKIELKTYSTGWDDPRKLYGDIKNVN